MKKLLSIIAVIVILASEMSSVSAAEYKLNSAFIDISSGNTAGSTVFFDEAPSFVVQIRNPESNAYNVRLHYNIYDDTNADTLIWSSVQEEFNLGQGAVIVKNISVPISRYGTYKLCAVFEGAFGAIEKVQPFAIAARNEKRDDFIGVQTHFSHYEFFGYEKEEISNYLIKNGGFGYIRDDHSWWQAESGDTEEKYVFPEYREKNIDYLISGGNKLIVNVSGLNPLYDDYTLVSSTDGINAYAEYCAALAEHYMGRINVFELCNEPDHEKFAGRDVTGDEYARVLKAARDAIKNVDKNITVVGGALCSYLNPDNRTFLKEFADEIKAQGRKPSDYMDIFSFHPYNNTGNYSDEEPDFTFLQNVGYVKEQLGTEIPIWISEYGVPICEPDDEREWGYDKQQQAAALVRTITAARSDSQISNFSIYNLRRKHTSDNSVEIGYGITDEFYNAHPAFVALSSMNRLLKDTEYIGKLASDDYYSGPEVMLGYKNRAFDAYRFSHGDEDIFVLWGHTGKASELTVNPGNSEISGISANGDNVTITAASNKAVIIFDMYGNETDTSSVTLSNEPVYVVCRPQSKVTKDGRRVHVEGSSAKPMTDITLTAVSNNELENSIIAIEQTCSDEHGKYTFDTVIPSEGYYLYVSEGGEISDYRYADRYEISMVREPGDNGTTVNVKITDNTGNGGRLLLFGTVYGQNDEVEFAECVKTEWINGVAELKLELSENDGRTAKVMLWDENQRPVAEALRLGQER